MDETPLDIPWAHVRIVDPDRPDAPRCGSCGELAVFEFVAEYEVVGLLLEGPDAGQVVREDRCRQTFSCFADAGRHAYGAVAAVVNARSAVVASIADAPPADG